MPKWGILVDSNLPKKNYERASHVVDEQKRVLKFIDELDKSTSPDKLGSILTESITVHPKNFENSIPQLDFLVSELIKEKDVLGARLTGGGFGGAVLARGQLVTFVNRRLPISAKYTKENGNKRPSFISLNLQKEQARLIPYMFLRIE